MNSNSNIFKKNHEYHNTLINRTIIHNHNTIVFVSCNNIKTENKEHNKLITSKRG